MRSAVSQLELVEPRSLTDALRRLGEAAAEGRPLTPIAGCTDVFVNLNFGTERRQRFLNLWGLESLRKIERRGDLLSIGALATYTDLIRSRPVQQRIPMLVNAAREVGGPQIQNRGTIGGNVANGSPAGDTLPVLAAAEAIVVLRSAGGVRRVPFVDFYTGYRRSVLEPHELVVAIEVPEIDGRQWFYKVGTRAANAISKIVMAAVRSERPRIAVGSVAPTVIRLRKTELALAAGASMATAQETLLGEIHPIDDLRSDAAYRRQVTANLIERFWQATARPPTRARR